MTMAPEPWVWLARIRRPQGRKGEVFAELLTDFPDKFAERRRLWLLPSNVSSFTPVKPPTRQVELATHWLHKGGIVLHFAGVDSIAAAEALSGLIVAIPYAERAALPPAPLLIVRGPTGEVLIPFAKSYMRRIDVSAKRVEMALPEGLVHLNAAGEA